MERVLIVGLEENEVAELTGRLECHVAAHVSLPNILVDGDQLSVQRQYGPGFLPVDKVVFHSIYADDLDFLAALALWNGPCLPNAVAMMDCRLKLPCLVRALQHTRFSSALRGYASPGTVFPSATERVAKWGNWHCGENKARFTGHWESEVPSTIEPFLVGQAVRVVIIGERAWQIRLEGEDWLKSIHATNSAFMEIDPELLDDTQTLQRAFGLEVIANDYIVGEDGTKHLLEVNHIPNVTRFPEIWAAY